MRESWSHPSAVWPSSAGTAAFAAPAGQEGTVVIDDVDAAVPIVGGCTGMGTAVLELGAVAGLGLYGPCSARDRAAVERLGAVAIDYRNEDVLARVREFPGDGVDLVLDGLGGTMSLRSFHALRPGGRLVMYGYYATLAHGRKNWRGWLEWYAATASVALWGLLSPRRRVFAYRIQKLREGHQVLPMGSRRPLPVGEVRAIRRGSGRTSVRCSSCSGRARSAPSWPSACHSRMRAARMSCWSSPRLWGSLCSYQSHRGLERVAGARVPSPSGGC